MRPGFTGAGLDRADHLRLDPEKLAVLAALPDARLLRLAGLDPVLDEAGRLEWARMEGAGEAHIFLGLRGEAPLFAPLVDAVPGQRGWAVFGLLNAMDPADAAIWGGARSVIEWHARHRFCGACAAPTEPFRAGWGRRCTGCRIEHFPPCRSGRDHACRAWRPNPPRPPARLSGRPLFRPRRLHRAGRIDRGSGGPRLMEEAGLDVGDVRYVASQPWPFPGQLMIGCTARATTDEIVLDETELEDAFWANREEVAAALARDPSARFLAPPRFAIAHTLLRHWLSG
jgi:NAD+ diphosphatase